MIFSSKIKLYYLKEKEEISFSIKVNDYVVNSYKFTRKQFEYILDNWNKPGGAEFRTDNGSWLIQHKKRGPRPECVPASFVRITFWRDEQSFDYRVDYDSMINIEKEYFFQKHNKMHWDN